VAGDGGGRRCPVCKGTGWIELLGAGMVHTHVFRAVGYDPEEVTGFAFGMGLERIAMMRYGISEIRMFLANDVRFLRQVWDDDAGRSDFAFLLGRPPGRSSRLGRVPAGLRRRGRRRGYAARRNGPRGHLRGPARPRARARGRPSPLRAAPRDGRP